MLSVSSFFETYLKPREETGESDVEKQLQLASAALMIELCRADQSIDAEEMDTLVAILREKFNLSAQTLDELMNLAQREVREATSLYQFTSLFNEQYDYAEKTTLIRNLWEVAFADGNLDRYEEH